MQGIEKQSLNVITFRMFALYPDEPLFGGVLLHRVLSPLR
jgi:hypothetical protein